MLKNKKLTVTLAVYAVIFYIVWAVYGLVFSRYIDSAMSETAADLLKEGVIKTLLWALPALLLMKKNRDSLFIKEDMFSLKRGWLTFLPIFIFFTVYILVARHSTAGKIALAENFTPLLAVIYLFVGFNEEIVFRGWLLNATVKSEEKKYLPMIVNAVMFLLIHFPVWIKKGELLANITSGSFMVIIFLSMIFSYSFIKTKNIVIPALLHAWWDFLLMALAS